jgi:hypothetical protein
MFKDLLSEGGKTVYGLVRNLEIRVSKDKYLLGGLRNEGRAWDLNRDRAETNRERNILSYFPRLENLKLEDSERLGSKIPQSNDYRVRKRSVGG